MLLLYAWSLVAYKKVDGLYWNVLFLNDDFDEQISSVKVCVNSTIIGHIYDSHVVSIEGWSMYSICIRLLLGDQQLRVYHDNSKRESQQH